MEKHVAVVCGNTIHDILVRPGTTSGEIVRQLELPHDFVLSKRDGILFGDHEEVYGGLRDGEKMFASAPAVVGSVYAPNRSRAAVAA